MQNVSSAPAGSSGTRRRFLRVSGAGVTGFALGGASSALAYEDGDNNGLQASGIQPVPDPQDPSTYSIFYDAAYTQPITNGADVNNGEDIYVAPNNESFDLDHESGNDDAVQYDNTENGDSIEVDLSVLDAFEENYDPTDPADDYMITDGPDSIGING